MEPIPRGSFILRVKRDKQNYRFTVRDLRTGQRYDAESWAALERFILDHLVKQSLH
jgi:hypothetical protein